MVRPGSSPVGGSRSARTGTGRGLDSPCSVSCPVRNVPVGTGPVRVRKDAGTPAGGQQIIYRSLVFSQRHRDVAREIVQVIGNAAAVLPCLPDDGFKLQN